MRRAHENDFLMDGDTFVGINLGADFTAEHEWGIRDLREMFGMDSNKKGIDKRSATIYPEGSVFFKKGKKHSVLICDDHISSSYSTHFKDYLNGEKFSKELEKGQIQSLELTIYKPYRDDQEPQTLATSWDKGSFGILVTKDRSDELESLYEAIKKKDVAIWLGGSGNPFQNSGLVVIIRSRCPEHGVKTMLEADIDAEKLEKADLKTGIKEKLKKAGKGYFACSPAWSSTIKSTRRGEIKTKYDVIYFLNPMEQRIYNFGWFTVEDLEAWIKDEGPIPMKKEGVAHG